MAPSIAVQKIIMRKFTLVLLAAALTLSFDVFGDTTGDATKDTKASKAKKCLFPKSRKRAPDWVCNAQADNMTVAAVGSFAKSGAGMEFMQQMAAADARVHLARKLHDQVQKKIELGTGDANAIHTGSDKELIRQIIDVQLKGSRILKSVKGPRGRLFVLIGLDEAGMQKLHESVTAADLKHKEQAH